MGFQKLSDELKEYPEIKLKINEPGLSDVVLRLHLWCKFHNNKSFLGYRSCELFIPFPEAKLRSAMPHYV
ncbi:MAG: hypothetical protein M0P71_13505 [Melioribacteraceae bacterium]|nr:hypothetical protein [Melioribacteraceae bacterium]